VRAKKLSNGKRAYLVRYRGPDGRERSKQFALKRDAEVFASSMQVAVATGDFVDPKAGNQTFDEWWQEWWPTNVDLRPSTRARDEATYRNHVKPVFGHRELGKIEHLEVRSWVAGLSARGLAPATVQKCHQIVGKALRGAVAARRIRFNVAEGVPLPRIEREEQKFLTPKEVARLADAIDPRYRHLVLLLAYGGLRIGEAAGLQWRNVNLLRRYVDVVQTVVEVRGEIVINPPKTNAGRRRVPIPQVVCEALAASTARHPDGDAFVVPAPEGGPLRVPAWRRRVWEPGTACAGLDGLRVHDLRHTAVALWISAGASPTEVQKRAGHTSASVVLDRYGHLLDTDRDELTSALDRLARSE
jgi:integrase